METREELLTKLYFVRSKLADIVSLQGQKVRIGQIAQPNLIAYEPLIPTEKLGDKLLLAALTALAINLITSLVDAVRSVIYEGTLGSFAVCSAMMAFLFYARGPQRGGKKFMKVVAATILVIGLFFTGSGGSFFITAGFVWWVFSMRQAKGPIARFMRGIIVFFVLVSAWDHIAPLFSNLLNGQFYMWWLGHYTPHIALIAAAIFLVKVKNARANERNVQIEAENMQIIAQYNREVQAHNARLAQLSAQQEAIMREVLNYASAWYPNNYYSLDAINFMINAIENFKADSIKEAVNLLDAENYRSRMMAAQQQLIESARRQEYNQQVLHRQMTASNVMQMMSLQFQQETLDAIKNMPPRVVYEYWY